MCTCSYASYYYLFCLILVEQIHVMLFSVFFNKKLLSFQLLFIPYQILILWYSNYIRHICNWILYIFYDVLCIFTSFFLCVQYAYIYIYVCIIHTHAYPLAHTHTFFFLYTFFLSWVHWLIFVGLQICFLSSSSRNSTWIFNLFNILIVATF